MRNPRELFNQVTQRGSDWFRIVNATDDKPAEIFIYDEIGFWGTTAADFVKELNDLDADEIVLRLASKGGDVFDGIAIYNALRTHPASIRAQVDSMAASIASVIAQAGDHRVMLTGSQMMIHEASGLAWGTATEMRDYADILDKQSGIISEIYAERSGRTAKHFRAMMRTATWMDAEETLEEALTDEVLKPERKEATVDDEEIDAVLDWSGVAESMETIT